MCKCARLSLSTEDLPRELGESWERDLGERAGRESLERAGRESWEVGVSRCKLLYIEWINNKILLYSTDNYIQYPMINHNGKEYFLNVYIYMYN